jgi:hypothetical protein
VRILPAGVPRGLSRLRLRIGHFFGEAPILFIGLVVGIAVVFRLGLGVVKPSVAEEEPAPAPLNPVVHTQPRAFAPAATTTVAGATAEPDPTKVPRLKPRTHGKR